MSTEEQLRQLGWELIPGYSGQTGHIFVGIMLRPQDQPVGNATKLPQAARRAV